jgi:hypothetical protein
MQNFFTVHLAEFFHKFAVWVWDLATVPVVLLLLVHYSYYPFAKYSYNYCGTVLIYFRFK